MTTTREKSSTAKEKSLIAYKKLDKAAEVAFYYGFTPIERPKITRDDSAKAKSLFDGDYKIKNYGTNACYLAMAPEEKLALLRLYHEKNMASLPQPVMIYFESNGDTSGGKSDKNSKEKRFNLEIIGTSKSVAEATLIKTAVEILRQEGFSDLFVDINSIGDKDSLGRFVKELSAYYRKNISSLSAHCRQALKQEIFDVAECDDEKCQTLKEKAPQSLSFLSEPSRRHFKEVLEYIESLNIPYRINGTLLGHRKFCAHTVFHIKNITHAETEKEEEIDQTLAIGFRYGGLSRKLDLKKEIPAVGVTIAYKRKEGPSKHGTRQKNPKIYFIQLGFEAKLKSLEVIEMLRLEHIPLAQSLSRDKLTSQLASAEHLKIPYALIMGQKEAVEGSVIVRNMNTRFQETVKIPDLPTYLKKYL